MSVDMLNLRTATSKSISTTEMSVNEYKVRFIDISGLLQNRKLLNSNKVPYFDDVNTILYMISLSSFDQTLAEDTTKNFDQIVQNPLLQNIHIVLFFNKKDLFTEKAAKICLNTYFPEYKGKKYDTKSYFDFIKKLYIRVVPTERRKSGLSIHVAMCNDVEFMRDTVTDVIYKTMNRSVTDAGYLI
jgi:hypothetical protein